MHLVLRVSLLALCASRLQGQWIPQQSNTTPRCAASAWSAREWPGQRKWRAVIRTTDGGGDVSQSCPGRQPARSARNRCVRYRHAVVAATAGRIWRTENGGTSWSLVYQAADTAVFLDAIGFWPAAPGDRAYARARGIVLADPIDGRFLLLASEDGGRTWREAPKDSRPIALPGEAAFAASGTSLVMHDSTRAWIGSGGSTARVFRTTDRGQSWRVASTPLSGPTGSAGLFSLSFADALRGIAIGGDFSIEGGATHVA